MKPVDRGLLQLRFRPSHPQGLPSGRYWYLSGNVDHFMAKLPWNISNLNVISGRKSDLSGGNSSECQLYNSFHFMYRGFDLEGRIFWVQIVLKRNQHSAKCTFSILFLDCHFVSYLLQYRQTIDPFTVVIHVLWNNDIGFKNIQKTTSRRRNFQWTPIHWY